MDANVEIWRDVPSFPEIRASSLGRVQVKPFIGKMPTGGMRRYDSAATYGHDDTSATCRVGSPKRKIIRVARLRRTFKVHALVCEAFHGVKPFPSAIVLHLDEDPSNNAPTNLRWGTRKENQNFPQVVAAFKSRTGDKSSWAIHQKRKSA
jgi:hypothetical protein